MAQFFVLFYGNWTKWGCRHNQNSCSHHSCPLRHSVRWDDWRTMQYDGYIFTLPDWDFLRGWMKMSKSMLWQITPTLNCALCVPGTYTLGRIFAWEFRTHLPVSEVCSKKGKLCLFESLWTAPAHQSSGAGSCPGGASDVGAWINQAAVMRLIWE